MLFLALAPAWGLCENAPPEAKANAAPAPEETFDINEFRVLGNTVLPAIKIEAAVYPFLGPKKTLHTVEQARDALIEVYKQGGFGTVLVDIPEQTVDEGIVRLKVTEGRIQKVRVTGARYYSNRQILAELPSLKPGSVPQLPELQKELTQLANEARDREITPVLKGGTEPGTVAVDLLVKDTLPLHWSLEADNRYTADSAHTRVTGNLSYDNLFQRNDSLSFQYQTAPSATSEVKLGVLTYSGHTWSPTWTWSVYGIRSDSNIAAIGTLAVIGNGTIIGGRLNHILDFGGAGSSHTFTLGFDYKDFGQTVQLPGNVSSPTPIHYLMWSAQYAFNHAGEKFQSASSIAVNFAIRSVADNDPQFDYKRFDATSAFSYLHGGTNLSWRLWHGITVATKLSGQYSEQPLINNEQFTLGGADTVRGYLEAEELVDAGLAGSLELRSPSWKLGPLETVIYSFYDRGIGMMQEPLPSQITTGTVRFDLYSWGGGFRLSGLHGFSGTFEWADPLVDGPRTIRGHGRALFSVQYGF